MSPPNVSDHEDVIKANRDFYRAFESLDMEKMEAAWLKDRQIVCIHPGWHKLSGWGPVMHNWERIFENLFEVNFEIGDIDVVIGGDLAVVVVEENLTQRGYDGVMRSQVLTTNVFERVGARWFLVMHHGSPVVMPGGSEPPLQ